MAISSLPGLGMQAKAATSLPNPEVQTEISKNAIQLEILQGESWGVCQCQQGSFHGSSN
jgi:hypothetical protein